MVHSLNTSEIQTCGMRLREIYLCKMISINLFKNYNEKKFFQNISLKPIWLYAGLLRYNTAVFGVKILFIDCIQPIVSLSSA